MNIIKSSVLDFPRKKLSETLWVYENPDDLPKLDSGLRQLILTNAGNYLRRYGLELRSAYIIGGAASYQWSEGTDIDVSLYATGWPDDIREDEIEFLHKQLKDIDLSYQGYPIHFFLQNPDKKEAELSEAVYDLTDDEWELPPLVLPQGFDPEAYFAPLIKSAERKAQALDTKIGQLRRLWKSLEKYSTAKPKAKNPDVVEQRIEKQKEQAKVLIKELAKSFDILWGKRDAMHGELKEKMEKDVNVGRFERFQEPEIIWKYLDRAGYIEFLRKLYKIDKDNTADNILAKF